MEGGIAVGFDERDSGRGAMHGAVMGGVILPERLPK